MYGYKSLNFKQAQSTDLVTLQSKHRWRSDSSSICLYSRKTARLWSFLGSLKLSVTFKYTTLAPSSSIYYKFENPNEKSHICQMFILGCSDEVFRKFLFETRSARSSSLKHLRTNFSPFTSSSSRKRLCLP